MSIEENRISDAGMLSSKDYLKLCDDTDFFNKKLDALKDMIHWRNEIFSEKEGNFLSFQS